MVACGQALGWDPRAHGTPHDHRCWLEAGHPVSERSGVQVHECDYCPLAWESDARPRDHCTCQAKLNPDCPTHGTAALRTRGDPPLG